VMFAIVYVWFKLSDKITPIRSKEEDELIGLDLPEMGVLAYPEFSQTAGHN
jgi:Amt family ammonium transporter